VVSVHTLPIIGQCFKTCELRAAGDPLSFHLYPNDSTTKKPEIIEIGS